MKSLPNYNQWKQMLIKTLNLCSKAGAIVKPLEIENPATKEEIASVEEQLGYNIPDELKSVMCEFSKRLYFRWNTNAGIEIFKEENHTGSSDVIYIPAFISKTITTGGILDNAIWDINKLLYYDEIRSDYEFMDENFPKSHWENSLIFASHGNGDYFGIDLKYNKGEVIYLSTNYDMHGWRLGKNFITFINEWFSIGCAGHWGEEFYLLSNKTEPYINSNSINSIKIKNWLGLQ